jgi:lysophospholipase L1-like esterase
VTPRVHRSLWCRSRAIICLVFAALMASCSTVPVGAAGAACGAPPDIEQNLAPLPHLSARIGRGGPVTIIALGSSTTEGTGASHPSYSYPSRLRAELADRLPGIDVQVLNRGVGGDTTAAMLARMEHDAIAPHPDLVIWQVGSNDVLDDGDPAAVGDVIHQGVARLKAAGADVILMDIQYAPAILDHEVYRAMQETIAAAARADGVPLFRRFDIMRAWDRSGSLPMQAVLYRDNLHMNDRGYRCLARVLAEDIVAGAR